MAAPVFAEGSGNLVNAITGTSGNVSALPSTPALDDVLILHVVQDGTAAAATLGAVPSDYKDLAGTTSALTFIGAFDLGSPAAAKQHLWIGRYTGTTSSVIPVNSSGGDDLYACGYRFTGVNTGTTLSDVLENSTAGSTVNGTGTSATVADTGVTTLGADRLALNFIGVNDDNALASFTGETGGDWTLANDGGSATGTDGEAGLQTATIASSGTINGGSFTMAASDAWGVVGFALKPPGGGAAATSLVADTRHVRRNVLLRR